jgi:glycine/D-amino acid oxidase-like deaminating enzyme
MTARPDELRRLSAGSVAEASLRDAEPSAFWLDRADRPQPRPALTARTSADLIVVGGGFAGLWTAVLAKERDPGRDVLLVEGDRIAWAASGRNGGFCSASLTHGRENGARRFPGEIDQVDDLGRRNLDEIEESLARYGIDCDFERTGTLSVAVEPYQAALLRDGGQLVLDQPAVRSQVNSPTYLAGVWDRQDSALLHPARLAWGLAATAERLGVRIAEGTPVRRMRRSDSGVRLTTGDGVDLTARQVALGTNAFPSLLRRTRLYTVPVYDYVLVTEPLSAGQLASVGWRNRQGVDDIANQFHYYRLTPDNRILWGGYDAIYHYGRRIRPEYEQRPQTFGKLARHFFTTFPQLEGIRFTHRWAGAIDTCTRFFAFHGTAFGGRVAYAQGFTGLGVAATRFGAQVMLDQLDGQQTTLTSLGMIRRRPLPFPPEPMAYAGIQLTRAALAAADRNQGRRNLWLRGLDRLGIGFDS